MAKYSTDFGKLSEMLIPEARKQFIETCAEMLTTGGSWEGSVFHHNSKLTNKEQGMVLGARTMMLTLEEHVYL